MAAAPMTKAATSVTEFSESAFAQVAVAGSNPPAAPRQLADALIRSMLAKTVATNVTPAQAVEASPVPVGGVAAKPVSRDSAWRGLVQTNPIKTSLVPAGAVASPVSLGPLPAVAQASALAREDQVPLASPTAVELPPFQPSSEFSKQTVPVVDDKAPVVAHARPAGPHLPVGLAQKTAKNGSRISAGPIPADSEGGRPDVAGAGGSGGDHKPPCTGRSDPAECGSGGERSGIRYTITDIAKSGQIHRTAPRAGFIPQ
jgi:hypothetical protein